MAISPKLSFLDDDLVRRLKEAWILEIGSALNSDLPENWIALATRLGLENNEIEQLRGMSNPGYEVLRRWKTRPNTTIRVLQHALGQMNRFDIIDRLEKIKTDPTDVTIAIRYNNQVWPLTEGGVAGLTTLLAFIRPHIHRKFSQMLTKGKTCARLHLLRGCEQSWTSSVAEFRGQQIDIELFPMQPTQERGKTEFSQRPHDYVGRDYLSYFGDESLIFDVHFQGSTPPPFLPWRRTSRTSLSNESEDQGPTLQNTQNSQPADIPFPIEAENNLSKLPGFHSEIPTDVTRRLKAEEALKGNLEKNGAYILRPATQENSVLALSVVYKRSVLHFSIMKNVATESCSYFIFTSNSFGSVPDLIAFYRQNSLSSDTMSVDTRGLFLTTPVS